MKSTRLAHHSFDRRYFLIGGSVLLAGALTGASRKAWTVQLTADPALVEDVVAANRILAALEIVDGYGHVSARHDKDPNRYLIARSVAPELVTAIDILELDLDSAPTDGSKPRMYLERFIHGEIYKRSGAVMTCRWTRSCRRRPQHSGAMSNTWMRAKPAKPKGSAAMSVRGNCGSARQ